MPEAPIILPPSPKAHPPGVSGDSAFARRRARRRDRALGAPLGALLGGQAATLGPGSLANAEGFAGFGGKKIAGNIRNHGFLNVFDGFCRVHMSCCKWFRAGVESTWSSRVGNVRQALLLVRYMECC